MIESKRYDRGALLVLDGELPSDSRLRELIDSHHPLVAADGAALKLRSSGFDVPVIIGDLDMIGPVLDEPHFRESLVVEEPAQSDYDSGKALRWISEAGIDRVTVLGAGGGMLDHVLNNFSVLARFCSDLLITGYHGAAQFWIVSRSLSIETAPSRRISLIPLPSARLRTTGLAWELYGDELTIGDREGASNRSVEERVTIKVEKGAVAVFHYRI